MSRMHAAIIAPHPDDAELAMGGFIGLFALCLYQALRKG